MSLKSSPHCTSKDRIKKILFPEQSTYTYHICTHSNETESTLSRSSDPTFCILARHHLDPAAFAVFFVPSSTAFLCHFRTYPDFPRNVTSPKYKMFSPMLFLLLDV